MEYHEPVWLLPHLMQGWEDCEISVPFSKTQLTNLQTVMPHRLMILHFVCIHLVLLFSIFAILHFFWNRPLHYSEFPLWHIFHVLIWIGKTGHFKASELSLCSQAALLFPPPHSLVRATTKTSPASWPSGLARCSDHKWAWHNEKHVSVYTMQKIPTYIIQHNLMEMSAKYWFELIGNHCGFWTFARENENRPENLHEMQTKNEKENENLHSQVDVI